MKTRINPFLRRAALVLVGSIFVAGQSARADSGTWNVDTDGLWSLDTNWSSNTIADGEGFTANFTSNITADRTVHLDGDRTLTNLAFGDTDTATAASWILDNSGTPTNKLILAGAAPTIKVNALGTNKTATISAIIEGTAGLAKDGVGTLVLSGANTYTGTTTVNGGTLTISGVGSTINANWGMTIAGGASLALNNTLAANHTDRLNDSGSVTMNGGSFNFSNDGSNTAFSETTGPLYIDSGVNTIDASEAGASGTSALTFASIAQSSAGLLYFTGTGLGTNSRNRILFTENPALANGIIGTWATCNGTDWATYDATNGVIQLATHTDIDALGSTIADDSASNVRINSAGSGGNIALGATTSTVNTLLQNATTAATVATASKTLRAEGIMIGSGRQALTIGAAAGDGTLTAATAGGSLWLHNQSSNALAINAVIADNTSASKLNIAGNVTLSGANTYTGGTTLHSGMLSVANNSALGTGTVTIGNATLAAASNVTLASGNIILGAGSSATVNVASGSTLQTATTSILTGSGSLNLIGGGTLLFGSTGTNNTNTGNITVLNGTLQSARTNGAATGFFGSGTIYLGNPAAGNSNNATIYSGNYGTWSNPITVVAGSSGTLMIQSYNGGNGTAASGPLTLNNNVTLKTLGGAGTFSFSGVISGTGGITTNALGTGAIILSKANTYTGATTVSTGTLQIGNNGTTGSLSPASAITNNATLAFRRTDTVTQGTDFANGITGSGGVTQTGTGTLILSGANTYTGRTTVLFGTLALTGTNGGNSNIVLSNNVTLAFNSGAALGTGSLLGQNGGASNYGVGATFQTLGTSPISIGLSTAAGIRTASNADVNIKFTSGAGSTAAVTWTTDFLIYSVNGTGTVQTIAVDNVGGVTFAGANFKVGTGAGGTTGATTSLIKGSQPVTISGVVSKGNTGTLDLTYAGSSTLTLSNGANAYTGATTVQSGSIVVGANAPSAAVGALGNASSAIVLGNASTAVGGAPSLLINGAFTVGRAISVGSVINTEAYNATIGGSNTTGTSIFTGNITLNTTATNYTATLQAATGGSVEFTTGTWTTNNKAIAIGSAGNTGTVILSNAIATTGGLNVNHGTLAVNGTVTGPLVTNNGATLAGTGPIVGAVTIGSGGHQAFALAASSGAQVTSTITGTLTLDPGHILDLTAASTPAAGTYTLVTTTGGITGVPGTVNLFGLSGTVTKSLDNLSLILTVGAASGYDFWMANLVSAGYTGDQTAGGDSDNDGMTNLMEYVINGNPGVSDVILLPDLDVTATDFVFTFTRRLQSDGDTTQTFEYGANLTGWTPVNITSPVGAQVSLGTPSGTAPNQLQTVIVTIPKTESVAGKLFGRLKVVK